MSCVLGADVRPAATPSGSTQPPFSLERGPVGPHGRRETLWRRTDLRRPERSGLVAGPGTKAPVPSGPVETRSTLRPWYWPTVDGPRPPERRSGPERFLT